MFWRKSTLYPLHWWQIYHRKGANQNLGTVCMRGACLGILPLMQSKPLSAAIHQQNSICEVNSVLQVSYLIKMKVITNQQTGCQHNLFVSAAFVFRFLDIVNGSQSNCHFTLIVILPKVTTCIQLTILLIWSARQGQILVNLSTMHTEACSKWLTFCRQHFQIHFLEWICLYFDSNFTDICS